ncbi:T9SS type B sorting domain-containing protein [Nonlabens xiamenensis]|uniref:T9SS type B sorting domain-containing protein n=1 Tax=Nonlabens xiamenensis TaxID=2341043 RepID=UPI000F60FE23|nr:gliding motility-associated C-terminal domain-containing protein [Nonlabens xiamenensis]
MKKVLLLSIFFLSTWMSFAQEESSWWIFGIEAAVEFTPNPQNRSSDPVVLNSGYAQEEGVGTISDDSGNLLFFTNGQTVFNRNGDVMPNGDGLLGGTSATQASIVVKAPETPGVYFIFTVGNGNTTPLAYSRIEMALNGGLGDVVPGIKNVVLLDTCAEKVSATIQTGTNNAYVMTFARSSATATSPGSGVNNALFAWEVRGIPSAGVSFVNAAPVAQGGNGGLPYYTTPTAASGADRGMLRISPDGTKLVVCNQNAFTGFEGAVLYDFNPSNGQFGGNGLILHTGPVYGAEFSATSQYLYHDESDDYGSTGDNPPLGSEMKNLYQYSLCDQANIVSSKQTIGSFTGIGRGTLQLAKDNNIYIAHNGAQSLGRISNVDTPTPLVELNAIDISPGRSKQGLPVFIQSEFSSSFVVNDQCQGDATEFVLACLPQVAASNWDFGDGNTTMVTGPSVVTNTYANPGTYTVSVNVTNVSGDVRNFSQDITIFENGIVDPVDNTLLDYCDDDNSGSEIVDLSVFTSDVLGGQDPNTFDISYHANMQDADDGVNPLPLNYDQSIGTSTIWVRIANRTSPIDDGCSAIGSFDLTVSSTPNLTNIPDFELCDEPNGDGQEDFDLDGYLSVIDNAAGNPVDVAYTIYNSDTDAQTETNPIDTSVLYTSSGGPEVLYVRLQNTNDADCFGVTPFNLVISQAPAIGTAPDLTECDEAPIDGMLVFDLSQQDSFIDPNGGNTVSYYSSQADAESGANALPTDYNASNGEQVFARLQNPDGCYNTTSFTITVETCEIVFPEGFSPNNDGLNDTFSIPGLVEQYDNFNLKVFNRNGSVVYETSASNYEEFAGIPNSGLAAGDGLLPTGVYFYVIQYNESDIEDTASWVYINY